MQENNAVQRGCRRPAKVSVRLIQSDVQKFRTKQAYALMRHELVLVSDTRQPGLLARTLAKEYISCLSGPPTMDNSTRAVLRR